MTATLIRLAVIYLSATCGRADSNTGNFTSLLSESLYRAQEWGCGGRQRVADRQWKRKKKKKASVIFVVANPAHSMSNSVGWLTVTGPFLGLHFRHLPGSSGWIVWEFRQACLKKAACLPGLGALPGVWRNVAFIETNASARTEALLTVVTLGN